MLARSETSGDNIRLHMLHEALHVSDRNRLHTFLYEHSATATSWRLTEVEKVSMRTEIGHGLFDP